MLILNLRKFEKPGSFLQLLRERSLFDSQLNQIVSPRNIELTVMELRWVWCEEWIRASNQFFSLTTFPPHRLSSKHLPSSVGTVSTFFLLTSKALRWYPSSDTFGEFLHFFSSVLVRNSAISSADSSEHRWLFSCSLTHRQVYGSLMAFYF